MIIKIPFNSQFIMPIARGQKIYTTRTKKYGKVGDYFYVGNKRGLKCIIMGIQRMKLDEIAEKFWWQEGFHSKEEFIGFWLIIHRKWTPDKMVYLHSFRRI